MPAYLKRETLRSGGGVMIEESEEGEDRVYKWMPGGDRLKKKENRRSVGSGGSGSLDLLLQSGPQRF